MTSTNAQTRDKLHTAIAAAVEERILGGELPVGEKLPSESELAREFGVSTRTVREAVQILETKGLVRRRHGERTSVVRADVGEFLETLAVTVRQLLRTNPRYLMEVMIVRRMIESDVIDLLLSGGNLDLSKAEAALADMRRAGDMKDYARFTEADAAFHQALVDAAGNGVLSIVYNNLHGLVTEVIRVTSSVPTKSYDAAYAEHVDIYNKIRAGDLDRAKSLMRAHIDNSAEYLKVAIEKSKAEARP